MENLPYDFDLLFDIKTFDQLKDQLTKGLLSREDEKTARELMAHYNINRENKEMEIRNIISFYDLPEEWQAEAISNLDEFAEETSYLEPLPDTCPEKHILWDLHEAIRSVGEIDGFVYNAAICISNNSSMLLNIDDSGETAQIKFV